MIAASLGALVFSLLIASADEPSPPAPPIDDGLRTEEHQTGIGLLAAEMHQSASDPIDNDGSRPNVAEWYVYETRPACGPDAGAGTGGGRVTCDAIDLRCEPDEEGNSVFPHTVRRFIHNAQGRVSSESEYLGLTCFPDDAPTESTLTDEMLIQQFHRTDFAEPVMTSQPPDGQALVNLPVYFQIEWGDGFGPLDIDSAQIINHEVRIRPTLTEVTYDFGDGNSQGPTQSLGGTYPDGDVTHIYTTGEHVTPRTTVVYGGEVSVDGDDWRALEVSVDITGPDHAIHVRTSTNRLIPNPSDN